MKKILFLIDSLGSGGAERALFNLSMNLDLKEYEVHIKTLYDIGVYKERLSEKIHYSSANFKPIRGLNYLFKFMSPSLLHRLLIKEKYDLEIAFLEGICTKIISGSDKETKKIAFVRIDIEKHVKAQKCYLNFNDMRKCYLKFDKIAFVGKDSLNIFKNYMNIEDNLSVVQNVVEDQIIKDKAKEKVDNIDQVVHPLFVSVGRLYYQKGYDLLIKVHAKLIQNKINHQIIVIGAGPEEKNLKCLIEQYNVKNTFILYGYADNPFKFISMGDWFVCSSRFEGFSSVIREAIILHKPIVTTAVSGTRELFENNSNGLICEFSEEGLYEIMKEAILNKSLKDYYTQKSIELSKNFSKDITIKRNIEFIKEVINK